jgi:hypothetical protein
MLAGAGGTASDHRRPFTARGPILFCGAHEDTKKGDASSH